jgi:16S rRNA (cytosine967-C5)-methyltransferase
MASLENDVIDILRLGAYQILEERVADHAAVHATVELAKRIRPAASGLVNAVLRNLLRSGPRAFPLLADDPVQHLVQAQSHPEWMVRRWLQQFTTAEVAALCAYNNRRPGLSLRVNRLRATRDSVIGELPGAQAGAWSAWSVRAESSAWSAIAQLLRAGHVSVQDESGVVVGDLSGARPGEFWIDVAAAPGGKCGALAEAVGETGRVIASDVSVEKTARLRETADRLQLPHLEVQENDARAIRGYAADGVILDAPCSGLGVLSRRPDARWRKQPADIARLAALQSELLDAVCANVRPDGTLIYSVCSFEPEETMQVVERFGAAHPDFALEQADVDAALQKQPGVLYCLPQVHGMDGGFAARWRRRRR